jgi:glyoxylase-like metal-dependent hydrolase (beta-lactamase superfamily II)
MANDGMTIKSRTSYFEVARGVWGLKDIFVNMYMIQSPGSKSWVLVDTGLKTSASKIRKMAEQLFGQRKPDAIILTHGHFDHVGSVKALAEEWDVPVYAHKMELPYLTGRSAYPPPDASVGGGMMTWMSPLYPKSPIDLGDRVQALPEGGKLPMLDDWKYVYTPGHAPGHISLFRTDDRLLIAGDAFVTTKQESALAALVQPKVVSGPPKYFTCDWEAAAQSVYKLAQLAPRTVATGHGRPMQGEQMQYELDKLVDHFHDLAVPSRGRYVGNAAQTDENGVQYVPPRLGLSTRSLVALGLVAASAAAAIVMMSQRDKQSNVTSLLSKVTDKITDKVTDRLPMLARR